MIALLAAAPVALPSDPPAHATISTVDESICTRFPLEALPRIANPPFRKFVSDLSSEVLRQPQAAAVEAPLDAQHVALNKCPRIPLPSRTEAQLHQREISRGRVRQMLKACFLAVALSFYACPALSSASEIVGTVVGVADGDTLTVLDSGRREH